MTEIPKTPEKASAEISQEELRTSGQRRVNIIWEVTQAFIAQGVVGTVLYVGARIVLASLVPNASESIINMATTSFVFLSNISSLVIGFYFGRTNHQRIGGIGGGGENTVGGR